MQSVIDFLLKDKIAESESLQKYRIKFIYTLGFLLIVLLFSMSIFRFYKDNYLVSIVDFGVGVSVSYMIYLINKDRKFLSFVTQFYLILFFLFTFFLIFTVEYDIKIILPYLFITAAIFLKGKKIGSIWLMITILTILTLSLIPQVHFPYHGLATTMMILLLISQYLILILYANQQEENILNLQNLNNSLEKKVKDRVKELALLNATLEDKVQEQVRRVQESLDNVNMMLDSTIIGIIVHDKNEIIESNQISADILGYTKKELTGRKIFAFIHQDDHALVKSKIALGTADPYEIRVISKEKITPVLAGGSNLTLKGKVVRVTYMLDLSELKQKDSLLQQQSRQAAMGEMIGNIAHQWRQPLNALGLVLQNIYFEHQMGTLDEEFIERSVDKGKKLTQTMSKTIDDFRNFFKPNKLKEHFQIADVINSTIELVEASFKNNNIVIKTDLDESIKFNGYPSEFSQVVLNILSNAKDALIANGIKNKKVTISTFKKENNIFIKIFDNAGGIPKEVIEKIFNPYFTTKEEGKGTGIGLYMSKTIIETNMGGKLSVENSDDGAVFAIELDNIEYRDKSQGNNK